jgi:hypothetical protein
MDYNKYLKSNYDKILKDKMAKRYYYGLRSGKHWLQECFIKQYVKELSESKVINWTRTAKR